MTPEHLIGSVTVWARTDDRISALALCGSYARGNPRPASDIDFCLICAEPCVLLDDAAWIDRFGQPSSKGIEDYGLVQSVRVFYRNGPEVEFGIASYQWMDLPIDPETAKVMLDGLRILYDPERRLKSAFAYAVRTYGDRPAFRQDEIDARRDLVRVVEGMLREDLPFFEGAPEVLRLRNAVGGVRDYDPDFNDFSAIGSESDHLPLAKHRPLWADEALERLAPEFQRIEKWASEFAAEACRNLLERFKE